MWIKVRPKIRPLILERDKYTCQECGWHPKDPKDYSRLHTHHLNPNGDHIRRNLVTLCATCHGKVYTMKT